MRNFTVRFIVGMGLLVFCTYQASAQWVQTSAPTSGGAIQGLAVNGGNIFAGTADSGVYLSTDSGTSWKAVNSGLTSLGIYSLAVIGGNIFAGTLYGGVFLSTNNGTSWKAVNSGLTGYTYSWFYAFAASGGTIFAANSVFGVFLSTNNGTSWTAVNSGLGTNSILSLAVNGSTIFAGTNGDGIFRSTNNGTSWTGVDTVINSPFNQVWSLAVSGGNIIAGTYYSGGLLSTNNGTSWTSLVNSGLTNEYVFALAVDGHNVFAGTYDGVFVSANSGATWDSVGPPGAYVTAIATGDHYIFAGTGSYGVWRAPFSALGIGVLYNPQRAALPQLNFKVLSPGFSNVNPTIEFTLPRSGHVTVSIYTSSGREIASLVNNYLGQGSHSIPWNTRDLAAGCYTVRLQAGANTFEKSVPIFR